MELALFVYFAEMVNGAKGSFIAGSVACFITGIIYIFGRADEYKDEAKAKYDPYIKTSFKWLIICAFIAVIIPTSRTMYTMAGAYAGQTVATHEKTNEIMGKTLKLINNKLDEQLAK